MIEAVVYLYIKVLSVCDQRIDAGPCEEWETAYGFDRRRRSCVPFHYGGCSGNNNRFKTVIECERRCQRRPLLRPTAEPRKGFFCCKSCVYKKRYINVKYCRFKPSASWPPNVANAPRSRVNLSAGILMGQASGVCASCTRVVRAI